MAEPIVIPDVTYWKLRVAFAEQRTLEAKMEVAIKASEAAVSAAMVAAGLTPGVRYNLDDATLTATGQP